MDVLAELAKTDQPMSSLSRQTLHASLREDLWFSSCDPLFQSALVDMGHTVSLTSGQELFPKGAEDRNFYGVVSGELVASNVDPQGNVAVLSVMRPGKWFGDTAVFDALPRTHAVLAVKRSRVLVIPFARLAEWLQAHPQHWMHLGCLTSAKLRIALDVLQDTAFLPLETRILRRLQLLSTDYLGRSKPASEVSVSQELLAQMMGVSRQSISKALRWLEQRKLIERRYGRIILLETAPE